MMSVKEYANDTNHTVAEILKKCEELGIKVKNGDDFLSDDDIIILDNAINLISRKMLLMKQLKISWKQLTLRNLMSLVIKSKN